MIGKQLGPYLVRNELGTGGMGTVYRAEGPDGIVALKVLHQHLLAAPGAFKRFLREAELGRTVNHENVVRTREVDGVELDGATVHFLVMDYVEGQTLRQLLEELGKVPEELCRHITASIADALVAIHAVGAVHRDLKPENVLLTPEHTVKVMDLGVALVFDEAIRLSQTGHFLGSVLYAAPEQWEPNPEIDARTDLFSVGVMLYELVTGRHPFRRPGKGAFVPPSVGTVQPAGRLQPQLSPFFEELTACLMARSPDARLPSATELARVVREAENSSWWLGRAPALRSETRRPLRRIRIPRETTLFGRDAEVATLHEAFAKAKAGHGQVVL
ncbi:MAG: serine/threonine-protein kinase, partial [Planctomycetota bacterium]